jgi:hypothetical protein
MHDAIAAILQNIPRGCIFDTHAVIEYLVQKNSDVYLDSYRGGTTESYHGLIGQAIAEFEAGPAALAAREGESWSANIHRNFSKCACWRKL